MGYWGVVVLGVRNVGMCSGGHCVFEVPMTLLCWIPHSFVLGVATQKMKVNNARDVGGKITECNPDSIGDCMGCGGRNMKDHANDEMHNHCAIFAPDGT